MDTTLASQLRSVSFVAIGCSAGGFDALGHLLPRLPAGFPLPIAVVIHMPPDREAPWAEAFQSRCPLPVKEAEDKEAIARGTVYFAPPNYHLQVEADRSFSLSVDPPENYSRPSIDVLFESAAFAYREELLGIVLTGANADGAKGLAQVVRLGGVGVAEDPRTASYSTMPEAARELASPQFVMNLDEIGSLLAGLAQRKGK